MAYIGAYDGVPYGAEERSERFESRLEDSFYSAKEPSFVENTLPNVQATLDIVNNFDGKPDASKERRAKVRDYVLRRRKLRDSFDDTFDTSRVDDDDAEETPRSRLRRMERSPRPQRRRDRTATRNQRGSRPGHRALVLLRRLDPRDVLGGPADRPGGCGRYGARAREPRAFEKENKRDATSNDEDAERCSRRRTGARRVALDALSGDSASPLSRPSQRPATPRRGRGRRSRRASSLPKLHPTIRLDGAARKARSCVSRPDVVRQEEAAASGNDDDDASDEDAVKVETSVGTAAGGDAGWKSQGRLAVCGRGVCRARPRPVSTLFTPIQRDCRRTTHTELQRSSQLHREATLARRLEKDDDVFEVRRDRPRTLDERPSLRNELLILRKENPTVHLISLSVLLHNVFS